MKVRHAIYGIIACTAALQVNEAFANDVYWKLLQADQMDQLIRNTNPYGATGGYVQPYVYPTNQYQYQPRETYQERMDYINSFIQENN